MLHTERREQRQQEAMRLDEERLGLQKEKFETRD